MTAKGYALGIRAKISVIVEKARSMEALPDHVGEDVINVLLEMGAEEPADSLDEEQVPLLWKLQK